MVMVILEELIFSFERNTNSIDNLRDIIEEIKI
jgi:hypothetical protein